VLLNFVLVVILLTTVPTLLLLPLQGKYRWSGVFLFQSFNIPLCSVLLTMISHLIASAISSPINIVLLILFFVLLLSVTCYFMFQFSRTISTKSVFLYGIDRQDYGHFLSALLSQVGMSHPKITQKRIGVYNLDLYDGLRPIFLIASENVPYEIEIQFGVFTRIKICAKEYKLTQIQIDTFKQACFLALDELSEKKVTFPIVIGIIILLLSLGVFFWSEYSVLDPEIGILLLYLLAGVFCILPRITYRVEIDEFLPER
jgi:hypothetical protein